MSNVPHLNVPACPPVLHIVDSAVVINSNTGEIEQTITLHENVKFTLCYSRELALRTALYLDAAAEQIKEPTK